VQTYRQIFAVAEFRVLFAACAATVAAGTIEGIALATLIYKATGSPLLSAISMFGGSLAQLLGAGTLLSVADHIRPRKVLVVTTVIEALAAVGLASEAPVVVLLVIVLSTSVVNSVSGATFFGLLSGVVPKDNYMLAQSAMNMTVGAMQIAGYAVGGLLLVWVNARAALLLDAGLLLVSAIVLRLGLQERPARAAGKSGLRVTWRTNSHLLSSASRRYTYLALWVPNGLVVGIEAMFIPYAGTHAAPLLIGAALGMLAGDTLVGRIVPARWRGSLISPARLLLALPYLLFLLRPTVPIAAVVAAVASVGYSASLMLQDRLIQQSPNDMRGQALGLQSAGTQTMQGVGAILAGIVASYLSVQSAITVMALASIAVTLILMPGLRRTAPTLPARDVGGDTSATNC
jgi:predicted MFS family arabinose efflux permease